MNARILRARAWIVLAGAIAMGAVACGQLNLNKAGGPVPKPVILTLADGEIDIANAQPFARAVRQLSHGALQIKIEGNWRPGDPNYETGLIKDVRAGKAQLGVTASAAFDTVGISGFQALQAPFLIDSIALERKVLNSGIPGKMLAGLRPYGLVGLGILSGPLRRPLGFTKPLVAAADYRGTRIGIRASGVSEEILRALGAKPVVLNRDNDIFVLDGAESHLTNIYIAFAEPGATLTWNVVIEPRPNVIFMNQHAFGALSPADQGVLIRAARQAPAASSVYESDAWSLRTMCLRGITTVSASQADLAGLRRAVRPVYRRLESNPSTKAFINQITAMRHATGSPPDPLACPPTGIAGQSAAAATILGGTWQVTYSAAEMMAAGACYGEANAPGNAGHFTLKLSNGHWSMFGPAGGSADGAYVLAADKITFYRSDHALRTRETEMWGTYVWSMYRDTLTFKKAGPPGVRMPTGLVVKPWRGTGTFTQAQT